MTYIIENDDGIKEQLIMTIRRAFQATSVVRAVEFSQKPINPLFYEIYESEYFIIIGDINKLFDRSKNNNNLIKLVEIYKNKIPNIEYQSYINEYKSIQEDYALLLEKIHRFTYRCKMTDFFKSIETNDI